MRKFIQTFVLKISNFKISNYVESLIERMKLSGNSKI